MTSFLTRSEMVRNSQDGVERHVWGEQQYVDGKGSIIKVKGTGSEDEEATVLVVGVNSFHLPKDSDTEVILLAGGADTNQKYALLTMPFDKQRQWGEGTGGIQHPTNPQRAVEFNGDEMWLKDGVFKAGHNKELEITISNGVVHMKTANMTIETDLIVKGNLVVEGDVLTHNGKNVGDDHKHSGVERGGSNTGNPT